MLKVSLSPQLLLVGTVTKAKFSALCSSIVLRWHRWLEFWLCYRRTCFGKSYRLRVPGWRVVPIKRRCVASHSECAPLAAARNGHDESKFLVDPFSSTSGYRSFMPVVW